MADRKREERIAYIITKLGSTNSEKAYSGLVEIRTSVIKSASGIKTLLRLGGLEPLVNQLKRPSSKLIDIALSILGNLSLEPELRDMVTDTSLLDHLVSIIKTIRDESILCRAYRTIGNLAESPALSSTLNDLRAPEMIIEALIGQKLFYVDKSFASAKRKSEQKLLERASTVDPTLEKEEVEEGDLNLKLKNEEAIQMAVRGLRQMADTKKHTRTMFEEGILYVLTELLKAENPATLKSVIKAYDHFLATDEARSMISHASRRISHYLAKVIVRASKVTDNYIAVIGVEDLGCERLVVLCEAEDKKLQDSSLALVCRLSRQAEFRVRLAKHGVIGLLMKKLEGKAKGTKGWQNLIHSLSFYCREHQHKVTEASGLPILHSAMIDPTLPEELRHFILNAFVQFSFHPKSLGELVALGLPSELLKIIQDFTVNNKFEGCYSTDPFEVTDAAEVSDDEISDIELPTVSKKEKSFRISSPSYQAIEEEISQMRKDEGPEVYNLWGYPSSEMGSVPVSPRASSEGRCSPQSGSSSPARSPRAYSPAVSPCSTPPLSPSEELFMGFEYASEPENGEDDENDDRCFSPMEESGGNQEAERPTKKLKTDEISPAKTSRVSHKKIDRNTSDLDLLLEQSDALHLSVKEEKKKSESENFPLGWSLALLLRFQCLDRKKIREPEELETLSSLTEYALNVKEPLRRSGSIIAQVMGKSDLFCPILAEKMVTKVANLLKVCKCERHHTQSIIGSGAFAALSEVADSAMGVHYLRKLLKENEAEVATSLPFLNLKSSHVKEMFSRTIDTLESLLQPPSQDALMAIRQYGREYLPSAPPTDPPAPTKNLPTSPCIVSTCDITFITRNGQVEANRQKLSENNEVFNAMLTRFHSDATIPFHEALCDSLTVLVHHVSGCQKSMSACSRLKGCTVRKSVLLGLADAYGVEELTKRTVNEMLSSKFSAENVVEIYKCICAYDYPGMEVRRRQVLQKIVNSDNLSLIRSVLESDVKEHFLSTIKEAVVGCPP